jgi:hypothetical protein
MNGKPVYNVIRLLKSAVCLLFIGLFTARTQAQILGGPPDITVQPVGLSVQNGGTAILTTSVLLSLTQLQFTWLLNGKPVPTTNTTVANISVVNLLGITIGTESILTVKDISAANEGNYSVQIKNGAGTTTSDNADVIVLASTVSNAVSNVLSFVSSGTGLTPAGFKIQLSGPAGSNYVIQASTDLKNWIPLSTNSAPTGGISYTDAAANNLSFRYYRAKIQ